uniref:WRKY19-like zinc finger domain-containing protein n=1 Tax=Phytophthora ramorum TaxID=164328 RepID=H3GNW9_PHYRM
MNGKADIAFLLNPKAQAQMLSCHTPEPRTQYIIATPPATPPPMSLFRSLSPVARFPKRVALSLSPTRKMQASYESVHQKRFSNVRCYGDDNTRLPLLSLAAMYAASSSNSSRNASPASSVASSELSEEERSSASSRPSSQVQGGKTRVRMTRTPPCQVEGCKNLAVSRGCCVRHGGGSRCTVAGCCKRAKLYQRCFQHGGYKTCTEPGCTKKAKRYGHCWSHGGGRICETPDCTKVSTQGGHCWAHGGGNRCKLEGCSRRSYQKYGYYCVHHSKLSSDAENSYANISL